MPEVYIDNHRVRVKPDDIVGSGGEAEIYRLPPGGVLKLFKKPDHPDYANNPREQEGARKRIERHQRKLAAFPAGLPGSVIAPRKLALDAQGRIVGYTMEFIQGEVLYRYSEKPWRAANAVGAADTCELFDRIAGIVGSLHKNGVVIGDFNDLNILVDSAQHAWFIDADSYQFNGFNCGTFTANFIDPLLINFAAAELTMKSPHNYGSDWYAFNVMLFQSLLFVGPYGGVYKPKDGKRITPSERQRNRLTVYSPTVIYPKPAVPWKCLPDELNAHFGKVFMGNARDPIEEGQLNIRWSTCGSCGNDHAHRACPACHTAVPVAPVVVVGKEVECTTIHEDGVILFAAMSSGGLNWLEKDANGDLWRAIAVIAGVIANIIVEILKG